MDSYLIDRETLGKFVDELLAKKYPGKSPAELESLREEGIQALDDKIGDTIFGALSDDQLEEVNALMDKEEDNPDVFRDFFTNAGVDLEAKTTEALQSYAESYLNGGEELQNV